MELEPKQKAEELVEKYKEYTYYNFTDDYVEEDKKYNAIQCAIIAVEEIIKSRPSKPNDYTDTLGYWQEVKKHLEL